MKLYDLNIEQFMKISLIIDTYKDDEVKFAKEAIKLFHGNLDITKDEMDETLAYLSTVLSQETEFIRRFEYKGVEYGFIPDLEELRASEFFDTDFYIKDKTQLNKLCAVLYRPVKDVKWRSRMVKFISWVSKKTRIPININIFKKSEELYDIEKYEGTDKYSQVMMGVSYKVALGAMVFFWNLKKITSKDLDTSTQNQESEIVT